LEGKNPSSIAAAAILFALKSSDPSQSAKEIAKAANMTPATITKIYHEIQANLQKV